MCLFYLSNSATVYDGAFSIVVSAIAALLYTQKGLFYPIYFSMIFSFLGFFFIFYLWDENTGDSENRKGIFENLKEGLNEITSNQNILYIGLIESIITCGFGLFLFGWTPLLKSLTQSGEINVGFAFVCFVMCLITGATIFEIIVIKIRVKLYTSLFFGILASIIFFIIVVYTRSFIVGLFGLASINGLIGFVNPLLSTIKSQIISESHRSQIMGIFRVPLNLFLTTLLYLTSSLSTNQVFLISAFTQIISLILCFFLTAKPKENLDFLKDEYKKIREES